MRSGFASCSAHRPRRDYGRSFTLVEGIDRRVRPPPGRFRSTRPEGGHGWVPYLFEEQHETQV